MAHMIVLEPEFAARVGFPNTIECRASMPHGGGDFVNAFYEGNHFSIPMRNVVLVAWGEKV